ncbi:MAG: peptidoglycan-binding protein [Phycisphaerae bacterium]|nr:peptidoglycan-binding protein [Phycisphaerae bacterium]
MPNVPGMPNIPGGGARQQKAAQLRAETEAKKKSSAQQATASKAGADWRPVKDGETLDDIAAEYGVSSQDIWDDPLNKQLRDRRGDPSKLAQGDSLYVRKQKKEYSGGPVGQGDYVVQDGDCISSIAKDTGHFWETLWNEPANSKLKEVRKDPNVLLPGDRVTIPEITTKQEPGETEMRHRFVRKGEPAKLRLRLLEGPLVIDQDDEDQQIQPDQPRGNVPYRLIADGERFEGTADADGWLECSIPGNARQGRLILNPDTDEEQEFRVQLGRVGPISELSGVRERLQNLGFECETGDEDVMTPALESALRAFQKQNQLPDTGEPDEATRQKLVEVHRS